MLDHRQGLTWAGRTENLAALRRSVGLPELEETGGPSAPALGTNFGTSDMGQEAEGSTGVDILEQVQRSQITESLGRLYQVFDFREGEDRE